MHSFLALVPGARSWGAREPGETGERGGEEALRANVLSREPNHFTPQHVRILTAIADGLGSL